MTAILLVLTTLTACSPATRARLRETRDQASLAEAVTTYWQGVRWSDSSKMSPYLVAADDQLAVARIAAAPAIRISNTEALQVVVDRELVDPKDKPEPQVVVREGAALVQVEWFGLDNRVRLEPVEQRWYLDGRGWHVDVRRSPLDSDRPW